jgi:hypothetical protein
MSCLGNAYLPVPPRVWNRVQARCSLENTDDAYINYLQLNEEANMLNKGNVLQYKNNSSNLTKNQKYAKMARGQWTNRQITWASQSQTVSNPNTKLLKRNGATRVIIDPITGTTTPTDLPLSCPLNTNMDRTLVIQEGGTMQCNVQENPCTGQVVVQPSGSAYFPTTDSDVPGPVKQLFWKNGTQTWYPKPRKTMNTSTTKWPVGAKHIRVAQM